MTTDTTRFMENPDYIEAARLLLQLHQVMSEGKGNDEEADEIRDAMEAPWYRLTKAEVARLNVLSADLYMLADDDIPLPGPPEQRTREWLEPKLHQAVEAGDWDAFLALLRNGPDYITPGKLAHFRAIAYARLGHLDIALLFAEYAYRKDSSDIDIAVNRYSLAQSAELAPA